MSIQDLIAAAGDRLTPTDRRIAEAVVADPSLLAFGTVTDVAGRAGTSPPSVVRFAGRLGFDGFRDLQAHVRERVSRQLGRPSERIRHDKSPLGRVRGAVERAVGTAFEALEDARLEALAAPVADARSVYVVSGETSMAGAHVLCSGLRMVRPNVVMVEEHSTGRDLSSAGPGDTAVVIDFPRYRRKSTLAARTLADLGVSVVAVTDGPLSPLAALTDTWVGLEIPAVGAFDSSVPAVIAAELLVARVTRMLGGSARERIDQVEALWEATGTFLHYRPREEPGG